MKKILVLYATQEGQTEKIAKVITGHLEKCGAEAVLANVSNIDPSVQLPDYDMLVFGASVHEGAIERTMQDFINSHARLIGQKERSFFLVSLSAAEKDQEARDAWLSDMEKKITARLQVPFDQMEMIAGALKYTQYNWLTRFFMKHIVGNAGGDTDTSKDFEYTDWKQVEDYASKLAQ